MKAQNDCNGEKMNAWNVTSWIFVILFSIWTIVQAIIEQSACAGLLIIASFVIIFTAAENNIVANIFAWRNSIIGKTLIIAMLLGSSSVKILTPSQTAKTDNGPWKTGIFFCNPVLLDSYEVHSLSHKVCINDKFSSTFISIEFNPDSEIGQNYILSPSAIDSVIINSMASMESYNKGSKSIYLLSLVQHYGVRKITSISQLFK